VRALTEQEQRVLQAAGYEPHTRVRVLRGSTWHDLTDLQGYDWLRSVDWGETVDEPVASATVECKRNVRQLSLSQFMQQSRLNRDGSSYSPLLRPGRTFVVETAAMPLGVRPSTNLLLRSEEFDNSYWLKNAGVAVTPNTAVAPGGIMTADTYATVSGTAVNIFVITPVISGATYTASLHIKRENHDWYRLLFYDGSGVQVRAWFNIGTGQIGVANASGGATLAGAEITSLQDGWFRISVSGSIPVTNGHWQITAQAGNGDTTPALGTQAYVWGAQLEAGTLSHYKPTTTVPAGDWREVFRGRIDRVESGDPLVFHGRGMGEALQETYIETERTYGSEAGVALHAVLQSILTDNGTGVALYTPLAPTFLLRPDVQRKESVLSALRNLTALIGWDVRYRWRASTGQYELTLYEPDRAKVALDWTWTPDLYMSADLQVGREDVRNVVRVVYSDPSDLDAGKQPKRKTVEVSDSASLALYGRRFMEIAEASTSQIDTAGEATTLANAALADLKEPFAEVAMDVPLFYPAELGDVYRFTANGEHADSNMDLAVVGYRHTADRGEGGKRRTRLELRGKPVAMHREWLEREAVPGVAPSAPLVGPLAPTALAVTPTAGGFSLTFQAPVDGREWDAFELHVSTTAGFTPSSDTLKTISDATRFDVADLTPGTLYRALVVPRDAHGNRGTASAEVSVTAGQVGEALLASNAVSMRHWLSPPSSNLIPNGFSEAGAAALGRSPEGDYLINDSANAVVGQWCRRGQLASGRVDYTFAVVPATPGEQFYFEAWAKLSASITTSRTIRLVVIWRDVNRNFLAVGSVTEMNANSASPLSTAYKKFSGSTSAAPAGTCYASFSVETWADSSGVGTYLYMDALSGRKMVTYDMLVADTIRTRNYTVDGNGNPATGAKMDSSGHALLVGKNSMKVGPYPFDSAFFKSLNALDGSNDANLAFYRGNNANAAGRGLAPNIDRLHMHIGRAHRTSSPAYSQLQMKTMLDPEASWATDNLDAMRWLAVGVYDYLPASNTLTGHYTIDVPVPDRSYRAGADPGGGNSWGNFFVFLGGLNILEFYNFDSRHFVFLCRLWNAYGASAERWFTPPASYGDWWNRSATSPTGGATAGGSGGGTVDGTCPAPWESVLLESGVEVAAEELRPGMRVFTAHEHDKSLGSWEVTRVERHKAERWTLVTRDGRVFTASAGHRLHVQGKGWTAMEELQGGDVLNGPLPATVVRCERRDVGPVVLITVAGAHTYITKGLLSHNAKQL
jgi:hypothetical protein